MTGVLDPRGPLPIWLPDNPREALAVLWQVEGAVLALVAAAALFAFESLTRERTSVPLGEYAARSGLSQFLMLGSAGLLAIAIVVIWPTDNLPPLAAHLAALTGLAGLASLPALLHQSLRVVQPDWLRHQRLKEVREAVTAVVNTDALQRAALLEFHEWIGDRNINPWVKLGNADDTALEETTRDAVLYDINLRQLEGQIQPDYPEIRYSALIGEQVVAGSRLVTTPSTASKQRWRRTCLMVGRATTPLAIDDLLTQIREEGIQAIRSGSILAIEDVASTYVDLWMAWPEAWTRYGAKVAGGILRELDPFSIGPVNTLQRHLWSITESAVSQGLRDHVLALTGIAFSVGFRAMQVEATDVVRAVLELARGNVARPSASQVDLQQVIYDRAISTHVELCDFGARSRLTDGKASLESRLSAIDAVEEIYRSAAITVKQLCEISEFDHAIQLDQKLRKLLRHIDRQLLEPASKSDRIAERLVELDDLRRAYRILILAWLLRRESPIVRDAEWKRTIKSILTTLGSIEEISRSIDLALSSDLLSRWITFEKESGEAHFIDSDGPILLVLGSRLLSASSSPNQIRPQPWMTQERIERAKVVLDELAQDSAMRSFLGLRADDVDERTSQFKRLLDDAERSQKLRETEALIKQPLDQNKVQAFVDAVSEGWLKNSVSQILFEKTSTDVTKVPAGEFPGKRLGYAPRLLSKGLFVTPTNWVGLEHTGEEFGRNLANAEVEGLAAHALQDGRRIHGKGDAAVRLRQAMSTLIDDGYEPSLILMPIDYLLARKLGLADWREPSAEEGELGHLLKGDVDGIPVLEWYTVPKDRLIVIDVSAFVSVSEGVDDDGTVSRPLTTVEYIDDAIANEIIAQWGPLDDKREEPQRRRRVLSSVRARIRRLFLIEIDDPHAACSVWLPKSARGRP